MWFIRVAHFNEQLVPAQVFVAFPKLRKLPAVHTVVLSHNNLNSFRLLGKLGSASFELGHYRKSGHELVRYLSWLLNAFVVMLTVGTRGCFAAVYRLSHPRLNGSEITAASASSEGNSHPHLLSAAY